jgi:hypothetical protein
MAGKMRVFRSREIEIGGDGAIPRSRKGHGQVGGNEGLSDTTLA